MANHKSAKKRSRQETKRNTVNKARISEVKSTLKKLRLAISQKDKTVAVETLPMAQRILSRLAQSGVIKKNNAARKTSRLTSQVNGL